jgi:hypothetical protein
MFWLSANLSSCPSDQCCVSESEKMFGYGFRFRYCCNTQHFYEKSQIKHLKKRKVCFFYWKTFFSVLQVPEHIWQQWEASLGKFSCQNICIRIRIRNRIQIRIRKILWIRIRKKYLGSTTLLLTVCFFLGQTMFWLSANLSCCPSDCLLRTQTFNGLTTCLALTLSYYRLLV